MEYFQSRLQKLVHVTFVTILMLSYAFTSAAQSADARIIFIGDAGKIDRAQAMVLRHASQQIIKGRTHVVFLGDNIYPNGIGLPGSREEATTKEILRSQFVPMRKNGAAVYFIPGNHDWDRSGKLGLAKVKRQSDYLKEQGDALLKMLPADGCPDPMAIKINDKFTIIVYDSEWWLFPYTKNNSSGACKCKNEQEVLDRLKQLVEQNKGKTLLVASHHPFKTYGEHGGYKEIPVFGGLYRVVKSTFPFKQDTAHPLYQNMVSKITAVFKGVPNVIYVAGHDHGLQFIEGQNIQIVSGAGAKQSDVHKGAGSLFATAKPGYVIADLTSPQQLKISFFAETEKGIQAVFTKMIKTDPLH